MRAASRPRKNIPEKNLAGVLRIHVVKRRLRQGLVPLLAYVKRNPSWYMAAFPVQNGVGGVGAEVWNSWGSAS